MSWRNARGMDALGMSDRQEMRDLLRELAAAVEALSALSRHHAVTLEALDYRVRRLEVHLSAHRSLLRSLKVSAWPAMMAGEFLALWEGEDE